MVKQIVGGAISVAIGGSVYTISQSDVAKNFSTNTGMSQQQAQQYVGSIKQSDLVSFSKLGVALINDGNSIQAQNIDCVNYTYSWVSTYLSCSDGKNQMHTVANDEIALGNCYQALDTNLGDSSKTKMNECVTDIDTVNADYSLPIAAAMDSNTITENKNTNAYNKSVLQTALSK